MIKASSICGELEKAAALLPTEVAVNYFGRPTKGAAYGLIARIRLHHASQLFNGGEAAKAYFGNWIRKTDGIHYVSQTPDEARWAVAAMAAKRIIDLNRYSLHTVARQADTPVLPSNVSSLPFPDGAGGIDPLRSYSDMFTGEALSARNPEFVWGCMSHSILTRTKNCFPMSVMGGWNNICIPQKMVDAYYMADGKDIHDSGSEYPYSEEGFLGGSGKFFSGYSLMGTTSNMYVNREMRFYANIGFSECLWTANSTSESDRKNIVVTYYYDGLGGKANAGSSDPINYIVTGYTLKKFIHADDAWQGTGAQLLDKPFPIIRYAEILLSYAEALNNLTQTHTVTDNEGSTHSFFRDMAQIKYYFNQVRFRAGLPGLTDAEAASPQKVQELIERERMIEFLFENRKYYDVRRWGIYEDTEKEPIMGMDTEAYKDNYYNRTIVNHSKARNRIVNKKLVFMPINNAELRKVPNLDQNPGWPD